MSGESETTVCSPIDLLRMAIDYAEAFRKKRGHLPLIVDVPIYEYFGDVQVRVANADIAGFEVRQCEVLIENGSMDQQTVMFEELSLRPQIR